MFTMIVVLYMAYIFSLPLWCKALLWVGMGIKLFELVLKFFEICIRVYIKSKKTENITS